MLLEAESPNYRHTGMDLGYQFIRFACNNRAGAQPFSGFRVFPVFPESGKSEWASVFHGDREWQLGSGRFFATTPRKNTSER
jgi:hypothetical protein